MRAVQVSGKSQLCEQVLGLVFPRRPPCSKIRGPSIHACIKVHSAVGGCSMFNPEAALASFAGGGMHKNSMTVSAFSPKMLCAPSMKATRVVHSHLQLRGSTSTLLAITPKPQQGTCKRPLLPTHVLNVFASASKENLGAGPTARAEISYTRKCVKTTTEGLSNRISQSCKPLCGVEVRLEAHRQQRLTQVLLQPDPFPSSYGP